MKTGQRYQTLPSDVGFKTGSRRETTVCSLDHVPGKILHLLKISLGKKIKRRLEDLERRASSPEGSPEQTHLDLPPSHGVGQRSESTGKRPKPKNNKASSSSRQVSRHAPPQHPLNVDDPSGLFTLHSIRDGSISPPPQLGYPYSLSDPATTPYAQSSSFQPLASGYPDYQGPSYYLPPLPTTLPSMPSYDMEPVKPEVRFEEDGMLNQFSHHLPYASFGGLETSQPQPYQDSNIHVNDLFFSSHSYGRGYHP